MSTVSVPSSFRSGSSFSDFREHFDNRLRRSRYRTTLVRKPTAIFWTSSSSERHLDCPNSCDTILSSMKPEHASFSTADVYNAAECTDHAVDSTSPFRSLNKKKIRDVVRAVKGKFRHSQNNQKMKIELIRSPKQQQSDNDVGDVEENRICACRKELDVGLEYLQKVVNKEKLAMLPGSAAIVSDTVLKLLLILNEKRHKSISKANETQQNAQSASVLALYNDVYHCLAVLLKYTDKLVVDCKVDTVNDVAKISSLNKNLKDAIEKLVYFLSKAVTTVKQAAVLDRTYSRESHGSSASSSDICDEDEDLDLLRELDHVNNNSCSRKGHDEDKPPPKPPHPTVLLFARTSTDGNSKLLVANGNRSPPSADSGVGSFTIDGANDRLLSSNASSCYDASFLSLDDLFTKLNLNNVANAITDWPSSELFSENGAAKILPSNLTTCVANSVEQQINSKQQADEQMTSEEKEEMCGSTMIKTKKVTTRQVVKHTIVQTQKAIVFPADDDDLLEKLKSLNNGATNGELKFVETENIKVAGLSSATENGVNPARKFPNLSVDSDGKIRPSMCGTSPRTPPPVAPRPKMRPVSDYDNNKLAFPLGQQNGSPTTNGVRTVKFQQNLIHQSSSVQSISRQAVMNGKVIANESTEKVDNATLKASKSDYFENGCLTDRTGSGSYVEDSRVKRVCKLVKPEDDDLMNEDSYDSALAVPQKKSCVSSYAEIFGRCRPENPTEFRAISLASYINMSDKWQSLEETNRKKAFTFQFTTSARNQTPPTDKQPWMELDKSATAPYTVSTKGGKNDYYNLMETLEMNDRLKFPHFLGTNEATSNKLLSSRPNIALPYVNFLNELDVKKYLYFKKDAEEGPEVRGAPIDVLIVYATNGAANQKGSFYQEAFLTTYRTFVTPLNLINKLIYRYEKFARDESMDDIEKKKIAKNTFSLLVCVVDDLSPVDLSNEVYGVLSEFLFRMVNVGELNLARYLRQRLAKRYQIKQEFGAELGRVLYSPYSPSSLRSITVLDFKSSLLAEQFTYLDWFHFKKIELSELLHWAHQQTEEHSPNLTTFTAHFNSMSYWVRTRVLHCHDAKERELVFAKFLKVMFHLRRLGNFNSLFAMLSALDSGSIRRLDWSKAAITSLQDYTILTESSQSFKAYRAALAETQPPCLPYIGIILQDLTFINIGNPNMLPDVHCEGRTDIVNFAKRWQQYTILDNMRRFKAWPYNLKKNEQVLAYLNDFDDHLNEDELWEKSEQIKPRVTNTKR